MMYSPTHRFVFIHIPKTAGTSIRKSLSDIDRGSRPGRIWNRMLGRESDRPIMELDGLHTHSDARHVRDVIGTETYRDCFSFAFVRNPWDRMLSLYNNSWQRAVDRIEGRRPPKQRTMEEELAHAERIRALGFRKWLLLEEHQQEKYGQSLTKRNQLSWLRDGNGELMTEFVGRLECIDEDITHVERHINARIRLVHVNKSCHRHYRAEYCRETREFVEHYFRDDIETFGYSF